MNQIETSGEKIVYMENDILKAGFHIQTGALMNLVYKQTGWVLNKHPELGQSFRLVVPLPDRLLNIIDGRNQQVSNMSFDESGMRLSFIWNGLQSEYEGWLNIVLRADISLTEYGLRFEMDIENHSPFRVESFAYPYLGDLQKPVDADELFKNGLFAGAMIQKPLYPKFLNERGYWGTEFPIQMTSTPDFGFLLVTAKNQGIYAGCHDTSAKERIEYTFRLIPGYGKTDYVPVQGEIAGQLVRLEFYAEHLPFVQPGETKQLSPIILCPYRGDWHAGADIYKVWRNTWMKKRSVPQWLTDVHSWRQLQMNTWADSLRICYEDLVDYADECVRHNVGAIQLTGWTLHGMDGRLPIHDTEPRLGTREELKEAIRQMQERGIKIILYEKYTCTDIGTDLYKEKLNRLTSKDIFGNTHGHEGWRYDTPAHLAGINIRPYAWMCMNSAEWQDIAINEIRKSLDLNPDGILLDECMWHGSNGFYCFDESHGHRIPAYNFSGDELFEKKLCKLLDEKGGDLVLAGENPYDLQNRHYNLTSTRTFDGNYVPAMRYIDPFLPMMNWVIGFDDRETINMCLLYRYIINYEPRYFRGRLEECPETIEYGERVDGLRRRYREYLWDAEFRDTIGATVTADGVTKHILYSVFQQADPKQRAVVIANHSMEDEILVHVNLEGGHGDLYIVTPEMPEPVKSDGTVRIKNRSAAVVLENLI